VIRHSFHDDYGLLTGNSKTILIDAVHPIMDIPHILMGQNYQPRLCNFFENQSIIFEYRSKRAKITFFSVFLFS
jgi:hypothetical protein